MKGLYPAVFRYDEADKCYYVSFPDVESCFTDGNNLYEAFENAEDVINLALSAYEDLNEGVYKEPCKIEDIKLKAGEEVHLIRVNTEGYKKYMKIIKYLELQREIVSNSEMIPVPLS